MIIPINYNIHQSIIVKIAPAGTNCVTLVVYQRIIKNFGKSLNNYRKIITDVPKQTSEILNKLKKGDLKVELQHKELDKLEREIDRGSNRVALSVLIAALIVASSLILNIRGNKTLAIVGYVLALVLSLFLVASIYKERNIKV